MNQKQRARLVAGFFLLIGATLFPPWRYSSRLFGVTSSGSSFGFLLRPPIAGATLQLSRLVVEWALIIFLTGGLFFLAGKPSTPLPDGTSEQKTTSQKNWRSLFSLSIAIYVLVVALGVLSYRSIRKIRRLETGIQNVKEILGTDSARTGIAGLPEGAMIVPVRPVGVLTPLRIPKGAVPVGIVPVGTVNGVPVYTAEEMDQMVQAEYDRVVDSMRGQVKNKDEALKRVREELDQLN